MSLFPLSRDAHQTTNGGASRAETTKGRGGNTRRAGRKQTTKSNETIPNNGGIIAIFLDFLPTDPSIRRLVSALTVSRLPRFPSYLRTSISPFRLEGRNSGRARLRRFRLRMRLGGNALPASILSPSVLHSKIVVLFQVFFPGVFVAAVHNILILECLDFILLFFA